MTRCGAGAPGITEGGRGRGPGAATGVIYGRDPLALISLSFVLAVLKDDSCADSPHPHPP